MRDFTRQKSFLSLVCGCYKSRPRYVIPTKRRGAGIQLNCYKTTTKRRNQSTQLHLPPPIEEKTPHIQVLQSLPVSRSLTFETEELMKEFKFLNNIQEQESKLESKGLPPEQINQTHIFVAVHHYFPMGHQNGF
jgi:hypothetical protein